MGFCIFEEIEIGFGGWVELSSVCVCGCSCFRGRGGVFLPFSGVAKGLVPWVPGTVVAADHHLSSGLGVLGFDNSGGGVGFH